MRTTRQKLGTLCDGSVRFASEPDPVTPVERWGDSNVGLAPTPVKVSRVAQSTFFPRLSHGPVRPRVRGELIRV